MANGYQIGDLVRIAGIFTNAAGTAVDPTAVLAKYKTPAGVITTLTYGVDVALVRDSVGNYHVDINAASEGRWRYRFYSTGTGQAANEEDFIVSGSSFD